tara:strand:+ start:1255 stop:1533 length:279 start_codon:yes stop_codon:yes gene_type:complete
MKSVLHPGRILREDYLKPLKLTTIELAKSLGVTRQTIASVLNERAGVSPIMALRLAHAFDTTPLFWLDMQIRYDLNVASLKFDPQKEVKKLV